MKWVCLKCEDLKCRCDVPEDTYPWQVLDCKTYVPEWFIEVLE
jgi:hypothetical protein